VKGAVVGAGLTVTGRAVRAQARGTRLSAGAIAHRPAHMRTPTQTARPAPVLSSPARPPTEVPPAKSVSPPLPVQVAEDTIGDIAHAPPAVPLDPTDAVETAPPLPQLKLPSP
jgi:hypothetical protein